MSRSHDIYNTQAAEAKEDKDRFDTVGSDGGISGNMATTRRTTLLGEHKVGTTLPT